MRTEKDRADAPSCDEALDVLLEALGLEQTGTDRYRAGSEKAHMFDRLYGGQLLAHALVAACATVSGKDVSSLHATFVEAGYPQLGVELVVDRVRDGRSMATRRVSVLQDARTLLVALVSFHANGTGPDIYPPAPKVSSPQEVRLLQEWAAALPPEHESFGRSWIDRPPALEIRIGEPLCFLGGPSGTGPRSHWMRAPRDLGENDVLNAALLAYGSDFFLMDMIFRLHPSGSGPGRFTGHSLDHAIWFHRLPHIDRWHLHTQEALALVGDRGLIRGTIHDRDGELVATVMQEVLVRPLVTP